MSDGGGGRRVSFEPEAVSTPREQRPHPGAVVSAPTPPPERAASRDPRDTAEWGPEEGTVSAYRVPAAGSTGSAMTFCEFEARPAYEERRRPYSSLTDQLTEHMYAPANRERPQNSARGERDWSAAELGGTGGENAPQTPSRLQGNASGLVKRIDVPQFSGDYSEYHSWREAFDRIVGELDIKPEYKIVHLRKCLSGDAKKEVMDLGCSGVAYVVALQRL